ncbi:MAG: hypothetical protein AB4050_02680 [Synechococcus sp.]
MDFSQLAIAFSGNALVESNYKRIQRFFKGFDVDEAAVAKALVAILEFPDNDDVRSFITRPDSIRVRDPSDFLST